MNTKKYQSNLKNALSEKIGWKMVAIMLVGANILLGYFVVSADTTEKTIVTPSGFNKPFWVKGSEVSPDYVDQIARMFLGLLKTYQSSVARYQFEEVSRFAHPSIYQAFKSQLMSDAERIERNSLGSVFYITSIDIKKNVAYVEGDLVGSIGSQFLDSKHKYFGLEYSYDGGNFYITGFREVVKSGKDIYTDVDRVEEAILEDQQTLGTVSPTAPQPDLVVVPGNPQPIQQAYNNSVNQSDTVNGVNNAIGN